MDIVDTAACVVKSPFKDVHVPNCDVWTVLIQNFMKSTDETALICSETGQSYSYSYILETSVIIAGNLLQYGYNPKKPIVIYMKSSVDFVLLTLAVWRAGGVVACLNPLIKQGEIQQCLQNLQFDFIVCEDFNVRIAQEVLKYKDHKKIYVRKNKIENTLRFSDLLRRPEIEDAMVKHPDVDPDSVCVILFSSGTTGLAKGIEITHQALVGQIYMWSSAELQNVSRTCAILYQPFSHVYGLTLMVINLAMQVPIIVMEKFVLEKYISHIMNFKSDQLYIVPPVAVLLCKHPDLYKQDLCFVRSITSAAAPLGLQLEAQLKVVFSKQVVIRQLYGASEVAGGCLGVPFTDLAKLCPSGSIGWPFPNVMAKIIDIKSGIPLGINQTGELCVKNEFFMKQYLNDVESTKNVFDRDGWLHTGDVAYYNENGCFFIVDRLKEIIKYKGYQVAPAELEAVLLSHPDVLDAGVTGIPDPNVGELPTAWVVKQPRSAVTEDDLQEYVSERVAPFKRLYGGIRFVKSIPMSPSGKILRKEIKRQCLLERNTLSKL